MTSFSYIGEGDCATTNGELPTIEASRSSQQCRDDCRAIGGLCIGYSHSENDCNLYGGWGTQTTMIDIMHNLGVWSYVKNHKENGNPGLITTTSLNPSSYCFASQLSTFDSNATFKVESSGFFLQLSHSSGVSLVRDDLPKISQTVILIPLKDGYQITSSDKELYLCLEEGRFLTQNASDPCTLLHIDWKGVTSFNTAEDYYISLQGSSPREFLSITSSGLLTTTTVTEDIATWRIPPADDSSFDFQGDGFCADTRNQLFPAIDLSLSAMKECESACKAIGELCIGYYLQSEDVPVSVVTPTMTAMNTVTVTVPVVEKTKTESVTPTVSLRTETKSLSLRSETNTVTKTGTVTPTDSIQPSKTPSLTATLIPTKTITLTEELPVTGVPTAVPTSVPTGAPTGVPTAVPTTAAPDEEYCRVYHFGNEDNTLLMEYALEGYPFIGVHNSKNVPSSEIVSNTATGSGKCYSKTRLFSSTKGYHTLGNRLTGGCSHTRPISLHVVLEGTISCEQICTRSGTFCLAFNVYEHECYIYTMPWITSTRLVKYFLPEAVLRSELANSSTKGMTEFDTWTTRPGNVSVCFIKDTTLNGVFEDCRYNIFFNETTIMTVGETATLSGRDVTAVHTQALEIVFNSSSFENNPTYVIKAHNSSGEQFLSHSCGSTVSVDDQAGECTQWGIVRQNGSLIIFATVNDTSLYLSNTFELLTDFDPQNSVWTLQTIDNSCSYSKIGVGSCSDSRGRSYAMAVVRYVPELSKCYSACKSSSEYCIAFQYDSLIQQCYIHGGNNSTLLTLSLESAGYASIAAGDGHIDSFGAAMTGMASPGPAHVDCYSSNSRLLPVVSIPEKPIGVKTFNDILISEVNQTVLGGLSISKVSDSMLLTWIHGTQLSARLLTPDMNDSLTLGIPFNINFDVEPTSELSCSGNPLTDLVLCVWEFKNRINCVVMSPDFKTFNNCRDSITLDPNRNISTPKVSPSKTGWVLVWEATSRTNPQPTDTTVAYQLISNVGEANGTVVEFTNALSPDVCSFGTRDFVLVWESSNGIVSHSSGLNSLIVSSNVLGKKPVVACGDDNNYVVVWVLDNIHNDSTSVMARSYSSGSALNEVVVAINGWDPTVIFQDGSNNFFITYMTPDDSSDLTFSMRSYKKLNSDGTLTPSSPVQNQFFRFNPTPPAVSSSYGGGVLESAAVGYVHQEEVFLRMFVEEQPNETQSPATPIPQSTEIPTEVPINNVTDIPDTMMPDESPQECQCADRWTHTGITYYGCQNIQSDGSSYCKLDQTCASGNDSLIECPVTVCSCADSWNHNNRPYAGCSVTDDLPTMAWCFVDPSCPEALGGREAPWVVCGKSNRILPVTPIPSTPHPVPVTSVPSTLIPVSTSSDDSFPVWGWVLINAGGLLLLSTLCYCAITKREARKRHQSLSEVPTATVLIDNMSVTESDFNGSQQELRELDWDGIPSSAPYDSSGVSSRPTYWSSLGKSLKASANAVF
eukprot:TRINITY_DN1535_c5_g1_i2.p1 TRINITY_DN1535_c5_g1~~TRINITY_DN1535_c5_g1_i2.p1  ORF type:complete len:1523 (+),score=271.07 TRINITY_DN1535_c5_g1_i2:126-4571(+)